MFKTIKALKALTPEQQAVMREKVISGAFTPRALIELLRPIAEFDRMSDKARAPVGCSMAVAILLLIPSAILLGNGFVIAILFLVVLAAVAIYLGVTLRKLMKLDLSNNFRQVAMPLFAVLHEDMDSGEPVHVRLDLSLPTDKAKKTGESEPYKRGAYHKVIDSSFSDPWFDGSAKLADGSHLRWNVTEDIVESKRTKRNARGKYKTKTKYYKRSLITADVALPVKAYDFASSQADPGEKIKVQEGEKRTTVKLAKKVKTKSIEPIDAREIIDIISEAYKRVKPAAGSAS